MVHRGSANDMRVRGTDDWCVSAGVAQSLRREGEVAMGEGLRGEVSCIIGSDGKHRKEGKQKR